MNIAVALRTAPRPQPTLHTTLLSLAAAGWPNVQVHADHLTAGSWPSFVAALQAAIEAHPQYDAYLLTEDDVIFCRNLPQYLAASLWPAETTGICSLYCPEPYRDGAAFHVRRHAQGWHDPEWVSTGDARGWLQITAGWYLASSLAWVLHPDFAKDVLLHAADIAKLGPRDRHNRSVDARVGLWANNTGRSVWYHSPSLAQHIGTNNSALNNPRSAVELAGDFIGEDSTP